MTLPATPPWSLSIALQHGVDADTLRHALMRNGNGVASGPLGTLLDLLAKARG